MTKHNWRVKHGNTKSRALKILANNVKDRLLAEHLFLSVSRLPDTVRTDKYYLILGKIRFFILR